MKRPRSYFLNLFTPETWKEFLDNGANETGFSARQSSKAAKTKPGDLLVCYLAGGEKAFVGLLEVAGASFQGTTRIWSKDLYPTRIPVRLIAALDADRLVLIDDILPSLERYQVLENKARWSIIVRSSLMEFSSGDGCIIAEKICRAAGVSAELGDVSKDDQSTQASEQSIVIELQRLRQIEPHISRSLFKRMEEEIVRKFIGL